MLRSMTSWKYISETGYFEKELDNEFLDEKTKKLFNFYTEKGKITSWNSNGKTLYTCRPDGKNSDYKKFTVYNMVSAVSYVKEFN